jgi:hypothetical protein
MRNMVVGLGGAIAVVAGVLAASGRGVATGAPAAPSPAAASPSPSPRTPAPEPPPEERFERDMMIRFQMHARFDVARDVERWLVRGNLADARALAAVVAATPAEPELAAWAGPLAVVRARAGAIAGATRLDDACRAFGRMAAACAGCHAELAVQPGVRRRPHEPADLPTVPARMARHGWAADRLWEGLIGGGDDAWRDGLDVLSATPVTFATDGVARARRAAGLRQLASVARRAPIDDAAARGERYGAILIACAGCHQPAALPR